MADYVLELERYLTEPGRYSIAVGKTVYCDDTGNTWLCFQSVTGDISYRLVSVSG